MKTNLLKLFADKEIIWFYRMKEMKSKMNLFSFCLALPLQFIGQHAFAFMHFCLECVLFVVARPTFKHNMKVMSNKVHLQQQNFGIVKQERLIGIST